MTPHHPVRRSIRMPLAGLLAGTLACGLTACGAGNGAQTAQFYSPGDGVSKVDGSLRILNALVVAPSAGGTTAFVSVTVANNDVRKAETLAKITASGFGEAVISGKNIPAGGTLALGAPGSPATATIANFTGAPGTEVSLDFDFGVAAPVRGLRTVIVAPTGIYTPFVASPSATTSGAANTATPVATPAGTTTIPVRPSTTP